MKKWLAVAPGAVLSLGIIYALVGQDIASVGDELARANYVYLIPTTLLLILSLMTRSIRWYVLLDQRTTLWHSFHVMNVGYFISAVLPFRLGDFARAYMTTRFDEPVPAFVSMSTIVVERLLDLLALVAMIGLMLVLLDVPTEITTAGALLGSLALLGGLGLALLAARPGIAFYILGIVLRIVPGLKALDLETRLHHFLDGIRPMARPEVAIGALFWSGISWILSLSAGYTLLFFLFDSPTVAATVSLIVLATMSVALPAVPGNLGPFEGAVVGGLWIGGMVASASPPENAPAVATGVVLHALTLGIYTILGVTGLIAEQASVKQVTTGAREIAHDHQQIKSESVPTS